MALRWRGSGQSGWMQRSASTSVGQEPLPFQHEQGALGKFGCGAEPWGQPSRSPAGVGLQCWERSLNACSLGAGLGRLRQSCRASGPGAPARRGVGPLEVQQLRAAVRGAGPGAAAPALPRPWVSGAGARRRERAASVLSPRVSAGSCSCSSTSWVGGRLPGARWPSLGSGWPLSRWTWRTDSHPGQEEEGLSPASADTCSSHPHLA